MARHGRYVIVGHPQHIIARGNNRQVIFCCNEDYSFYLEKLEAGCVKYGVELHSYVLMTNHVHLMMTPLNEDSISKLMQMQGRYYVQYFNYTYSRTGTLFEGRYKATLIDTERYLLTCMKYIELNPVRANMVTEPSEYPWSSYHSNGIGKRDDLVTPHREYLALGVSNEERLSAYRDLFRVHLCEKEIAEIRESTNKGWVLGSERFKNMVEYQLSRRLTPLVRGGDRRSEAFVNSRKIK